MTRITMANRYLAIAGMVFLAAMLLATISLTTFDPRWTIFLGGVLSAAVLASVSRTLNARWLIARRTSQLNATRAKLASEARLRAHAEDSLGRIRNNVTLVDESLPAMLSYFDSEERVRYHNQAYSRLVGRPRDAIDGRLVEEILGRADYEPIGEHVKRALAGHDVRYERSHRVPGGDACRLSVQYLPHFNADGGVAGVFAVLTDVTRAEHLDSRRPSPASPVPAPVEEAEQDAGARLISALERDEFVLHSQAIVPLGKSPHEGSYSEVLLRMKEEEEKQLPPGTFLPLAEELGLLHEIDRWVVRHVVAFAAKAGRNGDGTYFVNLSGPAILDKEFGAFVRERLKTSRVPDHTLCFELPEADLVANPAAYREFVAALDGTGCRFAVSGFGRNLLSLRLLKQLRVDFVKIDAGIVLGMLANPAATAKVKSINDAAHAAGMRTIAECVESEAIRSALAQAGTDFAQGFGVAKPALLRAREGRESSTPSHLRRIAA